MNPSEAELRAMRLEWLAARIVGGIGLCAIAAAIVLLILGRAPPPQSPAPAQSQSAAPAADDVHAQGLTLCNSALASAVNFGVLPTDTKLAGDAPQSTDVRGRYVCQAATDAAKYAVTFDLICENIGDRRCIALFRVAQNGGGTLYQRQD
jgi:hypothetical protein